MERWYFAMIGLTWLSKLIIEILILHFLGEVRAGTYLISYKSPTIVLAAVCLVLFFEKIRLLLAERGKDGEVYLVASGKAIPLRYYIEMIREKINSKYGHRLWRYLYGEGTVMYLKGHIGKNKNEVGFKKEISFEEGISNTIEWA